MYRQLIVFISLVIAANALKTFYTQGLREDGDTNFAKIQSETRSTNQNSPELLYVTVSFLPHVNTTVTSITHDIEQVFITNFFFVGFQLYYLTVLCFRDMMKS